MYTYPILLTLLLLESIYAQFDYGAPSTPKCPRTITQAIPSAVETTLTKKSTTTHVEPTTVYSATVTRDITTLELYNNHTNTVFIDTKTESFLIRLTSMNTGTTTVTRCPSQNTQPSGFPTITTCSSTVEIVKTIPTAVLTVQYTSYKLENATLTYASTVYRKTRTSYMNRTGFLVRRSITTFYDLTTLYAATETVTAAPFPSPTLFRLQAEFIAPYPACPYDIKARFVKEGKYKYYDKYKPALMLAHTGTVFNITTHFNTTVLGRPDHDSTCGADGAEHYGFDFGFNDFSTEAFTIACPRGRNGVLNSKSAELKYCYIDCLGYLSCAVGDATYWYFGFYIELVAPLDADRVDWLGNSCRMRLRVVSADSE